jgi:transcription antitermination factor NusG
MEEFKVGDMVEAYNGDIIGWITYINHQKEEADVEWDEGNFDYNCTVVPFKHLKKVLNCYR